MWEKIGYAAWASADPGLQFHTTINDWHTCPSVGPIIASNPCSEYMFLDDTSLQSRLAEPPAVFATRGQASFDIESYEHATRLWTHGARDLGDDGAIPVPRRSRKLSFDYRTLGLGYANVGGLLMSSGFPYDSAMAARLSARSRPS